MKRVALICLLAVAGLFTAAADDEFGFGVWFNSSRSNIDGVGLGVPVIGNRKTEGASLALCGNKVHNMEGFQLALLGFNYADRLEGVQLSFINMLNRQCGDFALQLGFYNQSAENGIQIGFLNNAKDNASFQLGLININKNGLLPVMIFVNFDKDFFD